MILFATVLKALTHFQSYCKTSLLKIYIHLYVFINISMEPNALRPVIFLNTCFRLKEPILTLSKDCVFIWQNQFISINTSDYRL